MIGLAPPARRAGLFLASDMATNTGLWVSSAGAGENAPTFLSWLRMARDGCGLCSRRLRTGTAIAATAATNKCFFSRRSPVAVSHQVSEVATLKFATDQ
jgi:hypothetical protein